MKRSNLFTGLSVATIIAFITTIFLIFYYAPIEAEQGIIQKIFYIHIPSAWVGLVAFLLVFIGGIAYLRSKNEKWYIFSKVSAEIGIAFTTIVLVTGPIWARQAWNSWWNWQDTKLDSALLLWLLFLGYMLIGSSVEDPEKRARFQSVYGIIAALDVPVVFFSIRWWQQQGTSTAATHPIIESIAPEILITLLVSLLAFPLLFILLIILRTEIENASNDIETIKESRRR